MQQEKSSFLLGLIGSGIQQSRTPAMHQYEGDAQGLRILYQSIDLDRLGGAPDILPGLIDAAAMMGFAGLNITHPCKQRVIPLLDSLSDEAVAIGAVNTVVFRDGKTIGYNTDCSGFAAGFRAGLPGADLHHVVQLGAGGAGTAVAHALLQMQTAELAIFDVDASRAHALAARLSEQFPHAVIRAGEDITKEMAQSCGLVHCTPTGMAAHPGLPLDVALLRPTHWVAEIVYFPLETALLKEARRISCRTVSGAGMAVYQAVDAFRHFTGREPDAGRMLQHFKALGA